MSVLNFGDRIGKGGSLRPGASALVFDKPTGNILLTRREDNGLSLIHISEPTRPY